MWKEGCWVGLGLEGGSLCENRENTLKSGGIEKRGVETKL